MKEEKGITKAVVKKEQTNMKSQFGIRKEVDSVDIFDELNKGFDEGKCRTMNQDGQDIEPAKLIYRDVNGIHIPPIAAKALVETARVHYQMCAEAVCGFAYHFHEKKGDSKEKQVQQGLMLSTWLMNKHFYEPMSKIVA